MQINELRIKYRIQSLLSEQVFSTKSILSSCLILAHILISLNQKTLVL